MELNSTVRLPEVLRLLLPNTVWYPIIRSACSVLSLFTLSSNIALAVGLGELSLHSSLGQRLDAEIQITSASEDELRTLDVTMASGAVFEQMGITQVPTHKDMRFSVESDSADGPVIRISSANSVREPFVNFVLELSWADGTYLREYTFLLDPVVAHRSTPKPIQTEQLDDATIIVAESEETIQSLELATLEPIDVPESDLHSQDNEEYILVVNRGDSLLDLARAIKPDTLSVDQVALAIYERNPKAFYGSINNLNEGAELLIPTPEMMGGKSARAAQIALGAEMAKRPSRQSNRSAAKKLSAQAEPQPAPQELPSTAQQVESSISLAEQVRAETSTSPSTDVDNEQAIAEVASRVGGSKEKAQSDSVNLLLELINDLRTAMLGLSNDLGEKNEQLDKLSERVNRLHQEMLDQPNGVNSSTQLVKPVTAVQVAKPAADEIQSDVTEVTVEAISESENTLADQMETVESSTQNAEPIGPLSLLEDDKPSLRPSGQQSTTQADVPTATITSKPENSTSASENAAASDAEKPSGLTRVVHSEKTEQLGLWLRRLGFTLLAMSLAYIGFRRLWLESSFSSAANDMVDLRREHNEPTSFSGESVNDASETTGPLSAIDFFKQQLPSDQRQELILKDKLKEDETRQDLRLDLLRIYHSRGATETFAQTARVMYQMTEGKNTEWHTVIQLGLTLDPQMRFYSAAEDHGFTLSDEFAITGKKISSVSGGQSGISVETEEDDDKSAQTFTQQQASAVPSNDSTQTSAESSDATNDRYDIDINFDENAIDQLDTQQPIAQIDEEETDNTTHQSTHQSLTDDDFEQHAKAAKESRESLDSTFDQIAQLDIDNNEAEQTDGSERAEQTEETPQVNEYGISIWKDSEVRLDLAKVYMDLGNIDGAFDLLTDVLNNGDATQVALAQALMEKLAKK